MVSEKFDMAQMKILLADIYAPWVQQLNITPLASTQQGYQFLLPKNKDITRDGDIICGQAIASVADSVGVLSLCHHHGGYRPMTTIELASYFMRPLFLGDVMIEVTNLSNGKRLATTRVDFRAKHFDKIAATANCIYAYL
ncbi:MAG: PaaI family thioesterase [Alphaproteobacteria bacterium]|nr:PaaI family thioesterase [Alphaproteobacteria bacterium]